MKNKKKKNEIAGNYSVTLENVNIKKRYRESNHEILCKYILLCIGSYGAVFSFKSCFDFKLSVNNLFMAILLTASLSFVFFRFVRQYKKVFLAGVGVTILFLFLFKNTLVLSMNTIMYHMNLIDKAEDNNTGSEFVFYLFVVIVILFMAYAVVISNRMTLIFLSSLPVACIGLVFNIMPPKFPFLCVVIFIVAMATITGLDSNDKNHNMLQAFAVITAMFTLYAIYMIFIPENQYKRVLLLDTLKSKIDSSYYIPSINGMDLTYFGGISGGKLGQFDKITYTNQIVFHLSAAETGKVYLRSFVGANYTNNSWGGLTIESENKLQSILNEEKAYSFELYNQTGELMKIVDNDPDIIKSLCGDVDTYLNQVYKRDFKVESVSISGKYYFLPYGNLYYPNQKSSVDGFPINNKYVTIASSEYSMKDPDYQQYKNVVDNYNGTNAGMKKYRELEKAYRKFVYSNYISVNQKYKDELSRMIGKYSFNNEADKFKVIQQIKNYLNDNYKYTLEPGALPSGKDFITYFLDESKQGYCTYFASAATMLFRAAGIPARYVEGYMAKVNQENLVSTNSMSIQRCSTVFNKTQHYTEFTVNVKDCDAHAWVEIYEDGYGWIPIEVTPGNNNQIGTQLNTSTSYSENNSSNSDTYQVQSNDDVEEDAALAQSNIEVSTNSFSASEFFINLLIKSLICIIVIFAIVVGIYVPAIIIEKKRDNLLLQNNADFKNQAILIYLYVEKICRYLKFTRTASMTEMEYFAAVKEKYNYLKFDGIDSIISVALKARFAQNTITEEEIAMAIESCKKIRKDTFYNLNKFQKYIYRFLYHLY